MHPLLGPGIAVSLCTPWQYPATEQGGKVVASFTSKHAGQGLGSSLSWGGGWCEVVLAVHGALPCPEHSDQVSH